MWQKHLPYGKVEAPEIEAYVFFGDQQEEELLVEVKVNYNYF